MKSGHTPGPWEYKGDSMGEIIGPNVVFLEDDGGCDDPECCGGRGYWVEIKEKDGHLIAAAPELLAAAVKAFDLLMHYEEHMDDCYGSRAVADDNLPSEIVELRTAIRKAHGQENAVEESGEIDKDLPTPTA